VVSHSDPQSRRRLDDALVKPGHIGTIYQASNAVYAGRTGARTYALLPDGTLLSGRTAQKIRAQERGPRYAEQQLVRLGARPMRAGENPASWLVRALDYVGSRRYDISVITATCSGSDPLGRASPSLFPARAYPKAADPEPVT
jgi:hypothetical protein